MLNIQELENKKMKIIDSYCDGILSKKDFIKERQIIDEQINQIDKNFLLSKQIINDYNSLFYVYKLIQKYNLSRDEIINILLQYGDKETIKSLRIYERGRTLFVDVAIKEYINNNLELDDIAFKYNVCKYKLKQLLSRHGDIDLWIKLTELDKENNDFFKQYYLELLPFQMMHDTFGAIAVSYKYKQLYTEKNDTVEN